MIDAVNVTKRYGSTITVDHLTFRNHGGEVTGFLGPNGAGTSGTMNMMVGLDRPTSGSVAINGTRYRNVEFPLHHVGALLEAGAIHPRRSARNHRLSRASATSSYVDAVPTSACMDRPNATIKHLNDAEDGYMSSIWFGSDAYCHSHANAGGGGGGFDHRGRRGDLFSWNAGVGVGCIGTRRATLFRRGRSNR